MDEDVAGTQAAGANRDYAICADCGQIFRRDRAHIEPGSLGGPTHSEYQEYCPGCYELNQQGERVLVADPDSA